MKPQELDQEEDIFLDDLFVLASDLAFKSISMSQEARRDFWEMPTPDGYPMGGGWFGVASLPRPPYVSNGNEGADECPPPPPSGGGGPSGWPSGWPPPGFA